LKQGLLILVFCTFVGVAFAQQAGTAKGVAAPSAMALTKGQAVRPDPQAKLLKDLRVAVRDLHMVVDSLTAEISQLQEEAQSYRNRPADILGVVATTITVLVALLAIVIGAGVAMAIAIFNQWGRIRKIAQEDVERTRKAADETQEAAKVVKKLQESLEEDARKFAEGIKIPAPGEEVSPEVKEQLEELSRRLERVEAFGGALSAEDHGKRGLNLLYKGEYDLAVQALTEAVQMKADYYAAFYDRACAYSVLGKREEALSDLKRAIDLADFLKAEAQKDEDFKSLRDDPEFRKLVE
jgi:tetratricopeptide (TPR) repeat protein